MKALKYIWMIPRGIWIFVSSMFGELFGTLFIGIPSIILFVWLAQLPHAAWIFRYLGLCALFFAARAIGPNFVSSASSSIVKITAGVFIVLGILSTITLAMQTYIHFTSSPSEITPKLFAITSGTSIACSLGFYALRKMTMRKHTC